MSTVTPNSQVNDYLNSDYQVTFTSADGTTTKGIEGKDIGTLQNIQLVDDDLVVQTDKGIITIHDVPQLAPPKIPAGSDEEIDRVVGRDFMADFNEVMKLFLEMVREQRDVNREMRNGDRQMMVVKSEEAITAMRDKAAKDFMVGMITNAVTIVSGALSMAGGIKSMKGLSSAQPGSATAAPKAPTPTNGTTAGNSTTGGIKTSNGLAEGVSEGSSTATTASSTAGKSSTTANNTSPTGAEVKAQATTAKYTAAGKILEGTAGATGSGITFWSTEDQEKQQRAETESGLYRSKAEDQNQYFRDSKQIINDAMNMLKAINDARHQTNSEIVSSPV
ncbi:hypothetical protein SG34_015160 [Thalassomonas viridans]|uniref:Uncharacterized protein n=1 Tax=Thalassomonas viridans TaxID=137584 RepID=A0AAE9Z083_9GAMM|nr:hypothetical protein [Thalassomonas viridans]WDE02783.1 hypothetical protein SG34_015160 [Thalassomonas viridans]